MNEKFELGFQEYDGWDKSIPSKADEQSEPVRTKMYGLTLDIRAGNDISEDLEQVASVELLNRFYSFFKKQQKDIFADIEKNNGSNIRTIIESDHEDFKEIMLTSYKDVAGQFASKIVVQKRDAADIVITQILGGLLEIVDVESGLITENTINTLMEQITEGLEQGWSMKEFQQAIIDTGVFSPARALRIARTLATGAANLGQLIGARETGATHKIWKTAGFEVRDSHKKMDGVKIPINEHFVVSGKKAMYPGDNSLPAGEKCNCRCSCNYVIED